MDRVELGSQLLCFSRHIANGMDYLTLRGYIHRDLAARNILLTKDNICKVSSWNYMLLAIGSMVFINYGMISLLIMLF